MKTLEQSASYEAVNDENINSKAINALKEGVERNEDLKGLQASIEAKKNINELQIDTLGKVGQIISGDQVIESNEAANESLESRVLADAEAILTEYQLAKKLRVENSDLTEHLIEHLTLAA